MSNFLESIKGVSKSEHATGALYFLLIGLALSDIVPTPADFVVFKEQKKLRDQYYNSEITPAEYWRKSAIAYYTYNFIFWVLLGLIIISVGGDFNRKTKIFVAIVGIGAVAVVLYNNTKKDEKQLLLQQESQIPKA